MERDSKLYCVVLPEPTNYVEQSERVLSSFRFVELYDAWSSRDILTRRDLNAGEAVVLNCIGDSEIIEMCEHDFVTSMRLSTMKDVRRQK